MRLHLAVCATVQRIRVSIRVCHTSPCFADFAVACNLNVRQTNFGHLQGRSPCKKMFLAATSCIWPGPRWIDGRVPRGDGAGPHARRRARRRPQLAALGQAQEGADPRRRHLGLTAAYELDPQGLRGAGARGVVPRRRPQHDVARRRSHRRDGLSAGLQLRQGSGSVSSTPDRRAFPGITSDLLELLQGARASSSSRSSTTTATPGCRTTRCSAASRSARAST